MNRERNELLELIESADLSGALIDGHKVNPLVVDQRFETEFIIDKVALSSPGLSPPLVEVTRSEKEGFGFTREMEGGLALPNIANAVAAEREIDLLADATPFIVINEQAGSVGSISYGSSFDAVVAIEDQQGYKCGGALIAPNVVLTARHCEMSTSDRILFGDNSNNPDLVVNVESVSLPGGSEGTYIDGDDIALVRLASSVPSSIATPLPLFAESTLVVGKTVSIVGYGPNGVAPDGHDNTADGLRWGAQNVVDHYGEFAGGENLFFADFDDGSEFGNQLEFFGSSAVPLPLEGMVAHGDSGSPLMVQVGDEYAIAGTLSGGLLIPMYPIGGWAFWNGVGRFEDEIRAVGGRFIGDGTDGGGGGSTEALPLVDDHANGFDGSTVLDFFSQRSVQIARDEGFIGTTDSLDDSDLFRFETDDVGRIIIDTKILSNNLNTKVNLYNEDRVLIAQNDDSESTNSNSDSKLIFDGAPKGEYFVGVESVGNTNGRYRVAVRSNADVVIIDKHGDFFEEATRLILDHSPRTTFESSRIVNGNDRDFFSFTPLLTGSFVVRAKRLSRDLNTVLRSFDENGSLIASNNNFRGSQDSRIRFNVNAGETYFVNLSSVGDTQGNYRISLRMHSFEDLSDSTAPFTSLRLNHQGDLSNLSLDGPIASMSAATTDLDRRISEDSSQLANGILAIV
ncbi:MAG: trypsin-like serine protease [Planctomycetota bacterium]